MYACRRNAFLVEYFTFQLPVAAVRAIVENPCDQSISSSESKHVLAMPCANAPNDNECIFTGDAMRVTAGQHPQVHQGAIEFAPKELLGNMR